MFLILKVAVLFLFALLFTFLYRSVGARSRDFLPTLLHENTPTSRSAVAFGQRHLSSLVETREVYSDSLGDFVQYSVLLPPSYASSLDHYFPIIYWLHGSNGSGMSLEPLAEKFSEAMSTNLMNESIVVFPESEPLSMWVNSKDSSYPSEDILINDLLPHINRSFRVSQNRDDHTIAGFSMGGYGAARLAIKHNKIFSRVVMVGAGTLNESLDDTPRANEVTKQRVLDNVYGGSDLYFQQQSPRYLSTIHKQELNSNPLDISIFVGTEDEVYIQNLNFSRFLANKGITNRLVSLPGINHSLKSYIFHTGNTLFLNTW